jgi:hypothetical protein
VYCNAPGCNVGVVQYAGETLMFWSDLTYANGKNINLIEGSFSAASSTATVPIAATALNNYFPAAKLGGGNYFYVYSGGPSGTGNGYNSANYIGISAITNIPAGPCAGCIASSPGLTVRQAYSIDSKIDDGLPQSGRVTAVYLNYLTASYGAVWAAAGNAIGANNSFAPTNASTPGTALTCYDNGSGSGPQQYSIEISGGSNVNCALSFRLQAGD